MQTAFVQFSRHILVNNSVIVSAFQAVVSRGGRPDLVGAEKLAQVTTPTLLLVGGHPEERPVVDMNQTAINQMKNCSAKQLKVQICSYRQLTIMIATEDFHAHFSQLVPGATHLFEEPGKLEEVVSHAKAFFSLYLTSGTGTTGGDNVSEIMKQPQSKEVKVSPPV